MKITDISITNFLTIGEDTIKPSLGEKGYAVQDSIFNLPDMADKNLKESIDE